MADTLPPGSSPRAPGRPADVTLGPLIVDAVLGLLADVGYARLTLGAVATRAGVSTATVYRRWSTKRELLLAVASQVAAADAYDVDTGSVEGDLMALIDHKRRLFRGNVAAALVSLVGEAAHNPDLAASLRESILEPTRDHLGAIVTRAEQRGQRMDGADPDAAARLIVGLIVTNAALPSAPAAGTDNETAASPILRPVDATLIIHALAPWGIAST